MCATLQPTILSSRPILSYPILADADDDDAKPGRHRDTFPIVAIRRRTLSFDRIPGHLDYQIRNQVSPIPFHP